MIYQSPTQSDFANVFSMNREFLRLMQRHNKPPPSWEYQERMTALGRRQLEWLAAAPFLLFSLQQANAVLWRQLLQPHAHPDLFVNAAGDDADLNHLSATSATFLWQLAQRNPYAARLISGASADWCDAIVSVTCFELVSRLRRHSALLDVRQPGNAGFWRKLLYAGVSPESGVRTSAHIAALQMLLTRPAEPQQLVCAVAACSVRRVRMRVADQPTKKPRQ